MTGDEKSASHPRRPRGGEALEAPERSSEHERLVERIERAGLSPSARSVLLQELENLRRGAPDSSESIRIRNYIQWTLELPWRCPGSRSGDPDFEEVAATLSRSHVGLEEVKQRISEFLAVRQLGGGARGTVLCLHGPPGTGKSSMARAVAKALRRRFLAIPVGAMVHERELTGAPFRRGGATPGKILAEIHRAGRADSVLLLEEIDRVSLGGEGTAAGALLHLLDPEQNAEFFDQYLGVPFDLSRCLLLATASDVQEVPESLLDRMEPIDFHGYTESEKYTIARKHLVPGARAQAGLARGQLTISPAALRTLIRSYSEEAGVRQLQRVIMSLARKAAVRVVRGEDGLAVKREELSRLLGPRNVDEELRLRRPTVGVATGLAWTSIGGSLLPVEALAMPGSGGLILTGSIGDVLRESVQAAISYSRTCFGAFGLAPDLLEKVDLHMHFPSAATPKDGPSAGLAIATALVSLLTGRPARHDVAMTGELSLLGAVLPVGGIREKLLAAIRAGIPEVLVPTRNAEEVLRLPAEVRSRVQVHLVDDVGNAFELALLARRARTTRNVRAAG